MQPSTRPRSAIPVALLVVGVGLTGYYGQQWYQTPHYSDADLRAATELKVLLEMQVRGERPDDAGLEQARQKARAELVVGIDQQRRETMMGFGIGLLALLLSLGRWLLVRQAGR